MGRTWLYGAVSGIVCRAGIPLRPRVDFGRRSLDHFLLGSFCRFGARCILFVLFVVRAVRALAIHFAFHDPLFLMFAVDLRRILLPLLVARSIRFLGSIRVRLVLV